MQICLSQQSLSPSHHFLHSNAFSHLYKNPPFSHTPWMCSFCRLTVRYFCTFAVSSEEMHDGNGVLHALLCTFYYQESVETIKMDAPGDFFFFFTMNHPPALLSTGGSPSMWRLCRMDRKGKCVFFFLFLRYKPYSVLPIGTVVHEGSGTAVSPPLTLRVASFPGLDWIVWNPQFQM